jgi:hypothetical protein
VPLAIRASNSVAMACCHSGSFVAWEKVVGSNGSAVAWKAYKVIKIGILP